MCAVTGEDSETRSPESVSEKRLVVISYEMSRSREERGRARRRERETRDRGADERVRLPIVRSISLCARARVR